MSEFACELCGQDGGEVVYRNALLRVVIVEDADYPGFCRVILNAHVREMTDLPHAQRNELMAAVFAVEDAVREVMRPDKINLASLGNLTPHLHWHIIPRFETDRHFPRPIWAEAVRPGSAAQTAGWHEALRSALLQRLNA